MFLIGVVFVLLLKLVGFSIPVLGSGCGYLVVSRGRLTDMSSELLGPLPNMYRWWWKLGNVGEYRLWANRLYAEKKPYSIIS